MSLNGKILFPNNVSHIFCGEDIELLLEIESLETIFVKEIFLNFRGEVNVKWEDLISKPKDGKIVYFMQKFEDQQILLNNHIIVQTVIVLNKGKHSYNMILNIPHQLPQSVSRKYGFIKYELELGVYNTEGGVEVLCKLPLDIKQYLNVYHHKEYMRPFHTVFRKSFCFGLCNSEPLKIILTLPKTTFMAGDAIEYFIKIEHFSKLLDLQRLSIILTQTQHYKTFKPKTRTKQVHVTLNQILHFFNENHHNSKLHGSFLLPQSLVPSSTNKYYVSTSYNLHFILVFTRLHTDGYISLPLIIGSHKDEREKIQDFIKYETKLQIEHDIKTECEV